MLGTLGFLAPWSLAALAALPVIWWLLRTTPPRPQTIAFPPTRLLKGLKNRDKTPARSPWWLTAIRMLAAACLIFALAEPVLNPDKKQTLTEGPLVLIIDNGWASANQWQLRKDFAGLLIDQAETLSKPVLILTTAGNGRAPTGKLLAPASAREKIAAINPAPLNPERMSTLAHYKKIARTLPSLKTASIYWLNDGLDYGAAKKFANELKNTLGPSGKILNITSKDRSGPLALTSTLAEAGKLTAIIMRANTGTKSGRVSAHTKNGQKLAEADYRFKASEQMTKVSLELPMELRNQINRLEIAGEKSAGAVHLLDARSRWNRIGLFGGTSQEKAQPLLAPLYYINRALNPYATLLHTKETNFSYALGDLIKQNPTVLILADIGKIAGRSLKNLKKWTSNGGVLIRFAGPRLEKAGDKLLPAQLRVGGRSLGGALSWSTPQPLAPWGENSIFTGLQIPSEVTIKRQVLADPARRDPATQIWARLKDGTPLVTAKKHGNGWHVLFHITANSDWSNLPLSGLFVEMLRRLNNLSAINNGATTNAETDTSQAANENTQSAENLLAPYQTMNGYGELGAPQSTARAIRAINFGRATPSTDHPPGLYGPADNARALNLITPKTKLKKSPSALADIATEIYQIKKPEPMKAKALIAALSLLFIDVLAVLFLQVGGRLGRAKTQAAILLIAFAISAITATPQPAFAQKSNQDLAFAQKAALGTRLAYVITGEVDVDRTSRLGLTGLSRMLARRTAVEPRAPMGVNVANDVLAFFPLLYWPVIDNQKNLDEATLAKIDAYMKQGGMIIFDTRDFQTRIPSLSGTPNGSSLQRLIGKLDIPRLEPVGQNHVLTKSFYLLSSFPGRWEGGELWVEAQNNSNASESDNSRTDGVSSILITSNDLAAAWAIDEQNHHLYPVVPGGELQREWAYRTGINIVMYALTGNYKADQVHVPALLERLGQ